MTMRTSRSSTPTNGTYAQPPNLRLSKIGLVTRDYNQYRDFSHAFADVVRFFDSHGCDAVLCSLFSVIPTRRVQPFADLRVSNIKAIFYEEFADGATREPGRYVVRCKVKDGWADYSFLQVFASLSEMDAAAMQNFVDEELPRRVMGNSCVILCGETNGVKYVKKDKNVRDSFGMRNGIPEGVQIILNPIHDRMTRFEMKLKRRFLSQRGRWVISVWNKGKKDRRGVCRDGSSPAWTIFHNGRETTVDRLDNDFGVEMGIVDTSQ